MPVILGNGLIVDVDGIFSGSIRHTVLLEKDPLLNEIKMRLLALCGVVYCFVFLHQLSALFIEPTYDKLIEYSKTFMISNYRGDFDFMWIRKGNTHYYAVGCKKDDGGEDSKSFTLNCCETLHYECVKVTAQSVINMCVDKAKHFVERNKILECCQGNDLYEATINETHLMDKCEDKRKWVTIQETLWVPPPPHPRSKK